MVTQNTQLSDTLFAFLRLIKDRLVNSLSDMNLSMVQLQTLYFLKSHNNCQMGEIAANFKIELPSATSLVNKLVREKLAARRADSKDRRIVRVILTSKGDKILTDGMKEREKMLTHLLSHLSEKDKEDLQRILQTIINKV